MSHEPRQNMLVTVATMYHRQRLTQAEIADRVKVSRQTVSRFLREAESSGIIAVDIRDPSSLVDDLAEKVRSRFGLQDATVVDVGDASNDRAQSEVTRRAARACHDRMVASSIIAMLFGPTVLEFSRNLPRGSHPDLSVTQVGGMVPTVPGHSALDPAVNAAAESLGAKANLIAAPLYVDTPAIREAIMSDSRIAATLENARHADMYIFSVGNATNEGNLYRSGYVTTAEIEQLENEGAVGELCGLFYDIAGRPCGAELESRTIAISRDDIKTIPQRILVTVGATKARAVVGALSGGYATEAFLDVDLAKAVLELTTGVHAHDCVNLVCPACQTDLQYRDGALTVARADEGLVRQPPTRA